jgi:hypothetical protein
MMTNLWIYSKEQRLVLQVCIPLQFCDGVCLIYFSFLDTSSNRRRKPGQDAHRFKTDNDTGKMVIDDADDSGIEDAAMADVGGTAYRESVTSVDGFTRGPNGRVKFNKDTKKRRREMQEIEDEAMVDGDDGTTKSNKSGRKANIRLGHEFKAKVSLFGTQSPILHSSI